ncbi:MAG: tetratricopeptide repeat protein [Chitinispirillaceae bacterium]|nr:tetratricopeptide repeat protein [Chitinispirillaceae bacterium]
MKVVNRNHIWMVVGLLIIVNAVMVFSDESFDKLFQSGAFRDALEYAEEKVPVADRDEKVWVRIAKANDTLGFQEKALASYLVAWRLNTKSAASMLGIATIYNKMKQSEDALTWAQKAFDVEPTAEAGWEYAKACIALNRPSQAKSALEKVIKADPQNSVAAKALGLIYFDEKNWKSSLPLLQRAVKIQADPELTGKIGKAFLYAGKPDSAVGYLNKALSAQQKNDDLTLDLARAYYLIKKYDRVVAHYEKITQSLLTADDLYSFAYSKETASGKNASVEYEAALEKFGTSTVPDALKTRTKVGKKLLDEKNYSKAVVHFKFITGADPDGKIVSSGYTLLADALKGAGDTRSAVETLERAIAVNKNNVEAYVKLGELYQQTGADANAKNILQRLISLSPDDPAVYLKLGTYSLSSGNATEALTYFQKSTSLKKTAESLSGTAVAHFKMKNIDNALDAASQALELKKDDLQAHQTKAEIYYGRKDYRNAQPHLEFLIKKMPANPDLMQKLADCYKNNNEKVKLYQLDEKIVSISGDNVESRRRLAYRADSLKLTDSARVLHTQLTVLDPKNPVSFKRLFEISIVNKDITDVVTMHFNRYVTLKSNDGDAYRDYGDYLYGVKDLDGALKAYRKALEIDPKLKGFHKRYAEIVIAKGQVDEAISACQRVIESKEADAGTYSTLGSIYSKKSMFDKAIEMYQNALQLQPADVNMLSDLADAQLSSGDKKSAAISYEQVVMMNGSAVKEYKILGDIYMGLSRKEEAVKAYRKYNEKVPSDADIAILLGRDAYENKKFPDVTKFLGSTVLQLESPENLILGDALIAEGKFKEAVRPLENVKYDRKKTDRNLQEKGLKLLAVAYEKSGRMSDAAAVYGEYLLLPGVNDPDAAYKRACLLEASDTLAALRLFETNTRSYPADYRNFLKAGMLLSSKKEMLERSVDYLRRVTELASEKPDVWLELARVYGKMRKPAEELDAYKKYAETNPQSMEANSRIGTLLMNKGMRNEAMVYLELANTLKPDEPEIMVLLAEGYHRTGRLTEAVDLLVKAKAKKPEEASLSLKLFELYAETNQKDKALTEIKVLVDKTQQPEYIVKYAEYLFEIGKNKDAAELLENILAQEPDNFDVLMIKARILRKDKKYDEAVEIYKEINSMMPDHIMSMFERAEAHFEQSKLQWAEMFYNRVLKLDPQFALAELGLARVAKVRKDQEGYREHLDKARSLDPDNKRIQDEVSGQK